MTQNLPTVPRATYRLQLTPNFGFDAAAQQLDTISAIGASHVYLSPIAQAVPESEHGYDVIDHTVVRREFGGADALDRLLDAVHERRMGVIVDHVPNHVSVEYAELNEPWWTMLRDGPSSPAARWFDVDWDIVDRRVVIPRLGDPLDVVLEAGAITIASGDRGPELRYGPLRFPLAVGTEHMDVREAVRRQHYLLSWWRDPTRNVRRFFTIDDLVAVQVENAEVADAVDTIPRRLVEHPAFSGIRVDHVDGLAEPGAYLAGLKEILGGRLLFVEKILGPGETVPAAWPVDGTTGYEHITAIEHALLDPNAEAPLTDLWSSWTDSAEFAVVEHSARREVLEGGLAPDLERVVRTLDAAANEPDADADATRATVIELTLALDRYRTYLPDDAASQVAFERAVDRACNGLDDRARVSEMDLAARTIEDDRAALRRWQQLTGPVMAKGAEDRAFYRYLRLASLCEVGGAPGSFSESIAGFHEHQHVRQRTVPSGMLAATTHDTKRSSGVRARSLALAARSWQWVTVVEAWSQQRSDVVDGVDPGLTLLGLQTAVSARPLDTDRLGAYLVKAAREADRVTSWTDPDPDVEADLWVLADALVADASGGSEPLTEFADLIEVDGARVDLALLAVQLTCPGFADLYQGSPCGAFTLVDPDNRRSPDWARLRELTRSASSSDVASAMAVGNVDLARTVTTERILRARKKRPGAFGRDACYAELEVTGDGADHVLAYARADENEPAIALITTRVLQDSVDAAAIEVTIPDGAWRDLLDDATPAISGGRSRLSRLDRGLGLVVLERTSAEQR